MTVAADHLTTARQAIQAARVAIQQAQAVDPDPEITDAKVYPPILNNLDLLELYINGRLIAGQPEVEREGRR